jgi:hypothetical protein
LVSARPTMLSDNYAAQNNLTQAKSSAYIPMPEGRGFTPTSVRLDARAWS